MKKPRGNEWLKNRYPAPTERTTAGRVRELAWRTTSDDLFDLPRLQDFDSVHLIDDRLPLKTLDYRLFAQDMFIRWVRQMTNRDQKQWQHETTDHSGPGRSGTWRQSQHAVLRERNRFRSLHNWWNNDDLVWDSVLAKAPSKLNLMEETGVMFYEKADGGASWRSEEDVSHLLERKLAHFFCRRRSRVHRVDLEYQSLHELDERSGHRFPSR